MSLQKYINGTWQEISQLKKRINGAWQDCTFARKYENGAWVDVYPSGVVGVVTFSETPNRAAYITDGCRLDTSGTNASYTTKITLNKAVDSSDYRLTEHSWITQTDSYAKFYSEDGKVLLYVSNGANGARVIPIGTKYMEFYTTWNEGWGNNALAIVVSGFRLVYYG